MLEAFGAQFAASFGRSLGGSLLGEEGGGPFVGGASGANSYGTTQDGSGWVINVQGTQSGVTASPVRTTNNSPDLYTPGNTWDGSAGGGTLQAGGSTIAMLLLLSVAAGLLLRRKGG